MRLDGFGLPVEDTAAMIRFHRDALGFEIREAEGSLIEIGSWNKPYEEKDLL